MIHTSLRSSLLAFFKVTMGTSDFSAKAKGFAVQVPLLSVVIRKISSSPLKCQS